jgi:hypothetical protein
MCGCSGEDSGRDPHGEEMRDNQFDCWQSLTTAQLEDADQQKLLNSV